MIDGIGTIADVWIENNRIYIETKNASKLLVNSLVRRINGVEFHPDILTWSIPASPTATKAVETALQNLGRYHESFCELSQQKSVSQIAEYYRTVDANLLPEIPTLIGFSWDHQKRGYHYLVKILGLDKDIKAGSAGAGLFADMGTGKTRVALGIISAHKDKIKRTLIIAPKRVIETDVWPKDAKKHVKPGEMPRIYPLSGSLKERADILLNTRDRDGVFIINYDALVYDVIQKALRKCRWDMILGDEIHKIKAPGGKTSKFLSVMGDDAKYRLGLTGTPNADKPIDVYGVYRFLDKSIFGTSYNNFKFQYAIFGGYMGREIIAFQNLEDLSERMYKIAFRVDKSILDLPEQIFHPPVKVRLSEKAQKAYNSMKKNMLVSVADGSATVSNTLTKIVRMQQITSGYLPVEISDTENPDSENTLTRIEVFEQDKKEALEEILDDISDNEPVVVFCKFIHDLENIRKAAEAQGRKYFELSGRRSQINDFNNPENGGCVIGVQITSGGAGIDLTRSHYCIYYSNTHSLTSYDQSLSRVHRPGQKNTVHYYFLICPGTVDVDIMQALREKKSVAKYVLDRIKDGSYEQVSQMSQMW